MTVSPPHGDSVLPGVSIWASPNLNILGVKFGSKLTIEDHVCGIVSSVSQRIGIMTLVKMYICGHCCVTSLLFCICFPNPWVLFSLVRVSCWMSPSASWTSGVFSGLALYRLRVALLSMLYKINSNSHFLFSELPSTFTRHTRAAATAHPLELEGPGVERPNLLGLSSRLRFVCGMTYPTLCLTPERWMGSRVQSSIGCCKH